MLTYSGNNITIYAYIVQLKHNIVEYTSNFKKIV